MTCGDQEGLQGSAEGIPCLLLLQDIFCESTSSGLTVRGVGLQRQPGAQIC